MALSRKKSRKIIIDETEFRWSPSQDSGFMVLVVQLSAGVGRRLEVVISDDKNVIVENGGYSIEVGDTDKLIITPVLVEQIIRDAKSIGWIPESVGPPVELSLIDNKIKIRRGLKI